MHVHRTARERGERRTAQPDASAATLDADALLAHGATLTISAAGPQFQAQTFSLPAPWRRAGKSGVRYVDTKGSNGPVRRVSLTKSASGLMKLVVSMTGKPGAGTQPQLAVVPPNPGTGGQALLQVDGGAAYLRGLRRCRRRHDRQPGREPVPGREPDDRSLFLTAPFAPNRSSP